MERVRQPRLRPETRRLVHGIPSWIYKLRSAEFVQPQNTALNEGALWGKAKAESATLLERVRAVNSPFIPVFQEQRNLQIVETAIKVAGDTAQASYQNVLRELPDLGMQQRHFENIVEGFFRERGLEDVASYGGEIVDLLREEKFRKRVDEIITQGAERYFYRETPLLGAVRDILDTGFVDIYEALRQHPNIAGTATQNWLHSRVFTMAHVLFTDDEWAQMSQEGITIKSVWNVKKEDIKRKISITSFSDPQRTILQEVVSLARSRPELGTVDLVRTAATNLGRTQGAAESQFYRAIVKLEKLFSPDELSQFGIDVNIWKIFQQKQPAVQTILNEAQADNKAALNEISLVEYTLKNIGNFSSLRSAVSVISDRLRLDPTEVYTVLLNGFLALYKPAERGAFFQEIKPETIAFSNALGRNEGMLTLGIFMALHQGEKFQPTQLSEIFTRLQGTGGEVTTILRRVIGESWLGSLVSAGIVIKEGGGNLTTYKINPDYVDKVVNFGVPLLKFLTQNSISARVFFSSSMENRLRVLTEVQRLLDEPGQADGTAVSQVMSKGNVAQRDPGVISDNMELFKRLGLLEYSSTNYEYRYIFAPKGEAPDTPRIAPRLSENRELGEAIYKVYREMGIPLSVRDIYPLLPAKFFVQSYEEMRPLMQQFVEDWKQGQIANFYLQPVSEFGDYKSRITQTTEQRAKINLLLNSFFDLQDGRIMDPAMLNDQAQQLLGDSSIMREVFGGSIREVSTPESFSERIVQMLFESDQPLSVVDMVAISSRARNIFYKTIPEMMYDFQLQLVDSHPTQRYTLTTREQLRQIGNRILEAGVITTTGRVLAYGKAALDRFIDANGYRDLVNGLRAKESMLQVSGINPDTRKPEVILIILDNRPVGKRSASWDNLVRAVSEFYNTVMEQPEEIRAIKARNKALLGLNN